MEGGQTNFFYSIFRFSESWKHLKNNLKYKTYNKGLCRLTSGTFDTGVGKISAVLSKRFSSFPSFLGVVEELLGVFKILLIGFFS